MSLHNDHVRLYYRFMAYIRQSQGMPFASTILCQWAIDEANKQ